MSYEILHGDCLEQLKTLDSESVQTCVTSPPYYGLRDYGVTEQIGLEKTPQEFIQALVNVFREVWRVLRDDGTLWINIGDSYANDGKWGGTTGGKHALGLHGQTSIGREKRKTGFKPKDLMLIPHRVAIALQEDGWYVRQDIVWSKPNPMPESVTDRCTKAHEYIFLLSKSQKYYFNSEAIKEKANENNWSARLQRESIKSAPTDEVNGIRTRQQTVRALELARKAGLTDEHIAAIRSSGITDAGKALITQSGTGKNAERIQQLAAEAKEVLGGYYREFLFDEKRNKRSVWTVATKPYSEAHFATFPEKLIEPCILAGSRESDTVLDPFSGAATTLLVALKHHRKAIGIELNPDYVEMSRRRLREIQVKLF